MAGIVSTNAFGAPARRRPDPPRFTLDIAAARALTVLRAPSRLIWSPESIRCLTLLM